MVDANAIDPAVLDALLESVGGDTEFLGELLRTYLDDSPRQFAAMRTALAAGNAGEFRRAAHSLKSNSANLGAMALSRMAKDLEDLGKAGVLGDALLKLVAAEEEYSRVRTALEAAAIT